MVLTRKSYVDSLLAAGGGSIAWDAITGKPSTFPPDPELLDDRVASLLVPGANMTLVYNDAANTLTLASSGGSGGGGIPEAPSDGKSYGRRNGSWDWVISHTGDVVDGGNF